MGGRSRGRRGTSSSCRPAREAEHHAEDDAAFYWVHDEPLLTYLGVKATEPRFKPTLYPRDQARAELHKVEEDPEARKKSRVSVLLANKAFDQTRTITHVLWAMFGVLPADTVQLPHRHESVALDYIIECEPGCYSLIGDGIDDQGNIKDAKRADWAPGSAFVTPPGLWHSHHNESGAPAHLMPIQDAGLHTYLRTLDIKFFHKDHRSTSPRSDPSPRGRDACPVVAACVPDVTPGWARAGGGPDPWNRPRMPANSPLEFERGRSKGFASAPPREPPSLQGETAIGGEPSWRRNSRSAIM